MLGAEGLRGSGGDRQDAGNPHVGWTGERPQTGSVSWLLLQLWTHTFLMQTLTPTLQGPLSDQDQYLGSSDPTANMKPLMYSQHYGGQPGYGGMPPDGGFHGPAMSGHMGPQRMPPAGYPPMMRMPGNPGPRPVGMRPGLPNPGVPQPNNLRLQLQHRLQAQLVGHTFYIVQWFLCFSSSSECVGVPQF